MASRDTSSEKTFFGHPRGLFTLFSTELWERFSYYGMKALLIYYMYDHVYNGGLGLDQGTAASIVSVYGALVYMSGIIGGWISDRILGSRRTILYGGILIMLGHIALSFPGGLAALFISMVLIVIGTGLLKPNVSNVVGDLYSKTDSRRDAGFSIFYMGVNLGAFIAPYIAGTLGQKINYHLGFGTAAIGMALGLIFYVVTSPRTLGKAGLNVPHPLSSDEKKTVYSRILIGIIILALLVIIGALTGHLTINAFTTVISILGVLIPLCYFIVMLRSKRTSDVEKSRLYAYIPLFIAAVIFWSIEEQGSVVLAIYADERTQLSFGGFTIASSWFQSLNPIFIVILAPVLAAIWTKLGKRQPITPHKFSLGLIFAGLSFLIMVIPAIVNGTNALSSPIWLALSFLIVVIGELCLSPVGLSVTTKLAPSAFQAQTMSLWLLSDACAQGINAKLTPLYNAHTEVSYFGYIGLVGVLLGIVIFFLSPMIHRHMRGLD
ncbi:POT family proton-dependent oligopeptide transporter [Pullulanibacillus pueri]|uniref:Putative transporter YclF n=1 Tax=Pullulanibacillus pueri TaxID=1437324 RepID=A0A8J2ZUM8_9BACL|nr:peptide MFS transporter [Pullulanibacillus pueri]MBM7681303.1 POT family proton-dependent oligopeptide transporter [Pullulanibacillus pueri]GGH77671.1 putative transporter YclF [Pullulanibacillus pueri]